MYFNIKYSSSIREKPLQAENNKKKITITPYQEKNKFL